MSISRLSIPEQNGSNIQIPKLQLGTESTSRQITSRPLSLEANTIPCSILKTGLVESEGTYYICECDPERINPICASCFMKCHNNGNGEHKLIREEKIAAVCICGYKCHKPLGMRKEDSKYKETCTFGELATIQDLNFVFTNDGDEDEENSMESTSLCIFCYNVCYKRDERFKKVSINDLSGFKCECQHQNHTDIRIFFRKLESLFKKDNFYKKYNFEGMTTLNFINIFTSTKTSFNNLFHSFEDKLKETYSNLQSLDYTFEDHNILNDLHLTCQVLLVFAMKCKNIYVIENSLAQSIENTENTPREPTQSSRFVTLSNAVEEIKSFNVRCHTLYYFNDVIKDILKAKIFYKIMKRKFDYKSRNIWQLKYFLSSIFYTFHIAKDFAVFPKLKYRDLFLLSPLQRIIVTSNIETEPKLLQYVNNLSFSYLNGILQSIESIVLCDEKSIIVLLILQKFMKIILIFAKFSLFNQEQFSKLCQLNQMILAYLEEDQQKGFSADKNYLKMKVVSQMMKAVLFLTYYSNDQMIVTTLNGSRKFDKLNFFHNKTEVCKNVTQNAILALTFIQRIDMEERDSNGDLKSGIRGQGKKDTQGGQCYTSESVMKIKQLIPEQNFETGDSCRVKRNISNICTNLLSLPLSLNEPYQSGLVRLVDRGSENMYKILTGNLTSTEREFVKKCRFFAQELESIYYQYFTEFNSIENTDRLVQKVDDILAEFCKIFVSHSIDDSVSNNHRKIDNENDKLLNDSDGSPSEAEASRDDGEDNSMDDVENSSLNNRKMKRESVTKDINSSLLTKSYFLQSCVKIIHILYYNAKFNQKKDIKNFQIKTSLFRHMIDIFANFANNNLENCFFVLQSEFLSNFELLNGAQLMDALNLFHLSLDTIYSSKRDIGNESNIIHFIKIALIKANTFELLNKVMKIIQLVCNIKFTNEQKVKKKMKRLIKFIFKYSPKISTYFYMIPTDKDKPLKIFDKETESLVKKFMRIINCLYTGSDILNDIEFFSNLLNQDKIYYLLSGKNVSISLRTEMLEYFRIAFLETTNDKKDINYYNSIFINEFRIEKKDEFIDNLKYHKFFEFLVKSGIYMETPESIEKQANVIKYELLNFKKEVLSMTTDKKKIKKYIESVISCLYIYFQKFSCLVFGCSGFNCCSTYEMVLLFLKMKKYIYSRPELLDDENEEKEKVLFINKMSSTRDQFDITITPEKIEKKVDVGNKKNAIAFFNKKQKKKSIINPKNDEERVLRDIAAMKDENFSMFNYSLISQIFYSHIKNFVKFPKIKGFKDYFEKKNELYSASKIKKIKAKLKSQNRLKTRYENDILDIILDYYNVKAKLDSSSFIKTLEEWNTCYNTTYLVSLCNIIVLFMESNNEKYNEKHKPMAMWFLFRLLQYHTTEIQDTFVELSQNNSGETPLLNFNKIVSSFTSSVVSVFLHEINPNASCMKHEYFNTIMNIKILKYFCEEHNPIFQTIFFNNTNASQESDVIVMYKHHLKLKPHKKYFSTAERMQEDNAENFFLNKLPTNARMSVDMELPGFGVYGRKASVFEYLLSILSKIILASKWMTNKGEEPNEFFYDLYFVVLEFLIETIQGTSSENLIKVFYNENRSKCLFTNFLGEINHLIIDDTFNSDLYYQLRKDMIDFIMAFLEESATPSSGIIEISSVLLPATILDSIIETMRNLYEQLLGDKLNDVVDESTSASSSSRKQIFTPEMKRYFSNIYLNDPEFGDNQLFALANRMYQYFKNLSLDTDFKSKFVNDFYVKMDMFTETEIELSFYNKNIKLINKITNAQITDQKFIEQYICVSFFESITRTVMVQKEDEDKPVSVIFTVNPIVPLLSKRSKEDFIENVDRSDQSTKLFQLMEQCDNFFEEINYKSINGKSNCLMTLISNINFYYFELVAFVITASVNMIMIIVLKGEGDVLFGDNKINYVILDLGYANLAFNVVTVILWLIANYNQLYMTECQKMLKEYQRKEKNNDEEKEILLSAKDKFKAAYIVIIRKKKLLPFLWNILFSAVGSVTQIYFIFIVQLLIIFNLTQTLRNIVGSMALKGEQLGLVFYISVVVNLVLAAVAFLYFEEDFTNTIDSKMPHYFPEDFEFLMDIIGSPLMEPSHKESECGTLLYCFATHLDYGMRFDGGIADRMQKRSYNISGSFYLSRFFYEIIYFILQTVMLQGMIFSIVVEAFFELVNGENMVNKDKKEICFICGIEKTSYEKNGKKFEEHTSKEHNLWTYVEYILGLRFVDIQDTNAVNSYVIEKIENRELSWFPRHKDLLE